MIHRHHSLTSVDVLRGLVELGKKREIEQGEVK
jgi:hypothetical protein